MENETDVFINYIKKIINDVLDKREIALKEEEAKKIVEAILPELDELISKRVKEHFSLLADLMKEKFSSRE